jgi:ribulose-phosphate 3-epimerase
MNNTKKIIPAILPSDFFDLKKHLERVKGVTNCVQIDICNSTYTPSKTWPYTHTPDIYFDKLVTQEEGMPFWQDIDFELDMMIKNPEEVFEQFLNLGPTRIIFHFETLKDPKNFLQMCKETYPIIQFGIAFSNETRAIDYVDVIEIADIVQCMGISKIGFQRQAFDERVLNQVEEIRKLFPDKIIAVDGSVNEDTMEELSHAGVNHFVTGSAFFGTDNLVGTFEYFEDLIK